MEKKNNDFKVSSIGEASKRPRTLVSPLQIRLEVQLHHSFASRFFVSTLNSLGICYSFFEVQRFESNAAISQGLDIPGDLSQSFIRYVANNVDHNLRKLDGNNTFRGMGIICGITLCTMQQRPIRREVVSAKKIKSIANVEIEFYKQSNNSAITITLEDLKTMKNIDISSCLDFLLLVIWQLKKSYTGVVRRNASDTKRAIPW